MKHVASNEAKLVQSTAQEAITSYRRDANAAKALDTLTKLKGIGPATASLLLAVHDPDKAIFFSDEAFWWLCCKGEKAPIKYNAKEYKDLNEKARKLIDRLGVKAIDVEKVAYVVMKTDAASAPAAAASKPGGKPPAKKSQPMASKTAVPKKPAAGKRKQDADNTKDDSTLRRSKRTRGS